MGRAKIIRSIKPRTIRESSFSIFTMRVNYCFLLLDVILVARRRIRNSWIILSSPVRPLLLDCVQRFSNKSIFPITLLKIILFRFQFFSRLQYEKESITNIEINHGFDAKKKTDIYRFLNFSSPCAYWAL